jgi:hypothetical protein
MIVCCLSYLKQIHYFCGPRWRGSSVGKSAGFITLRSGVQLPISLHSWKSELLGFQLFYFLLLVGALGKHYVLPGVSLRRRGGASFRYGGAILQRFRHLVLLHTPAMFLCSRFPGCNVEVFYVLL